MYAATLAEPTNDTAETSGWVRSASTESFAPWTTLNTPSGSPDSVRSSAIRMAESGVRCDGLCTNVFPHTMASGIIHSGTMLGKLKGVMPATTPTGNRTSSSSMPSAIWSRLVPIISEGAPQASSTTSMARRTSPLASGSVLPFSWVTSRESSSNRSSSRALNRNITWARSGTGVSAQAGKASAAARTARSISSGVEYGSSAMVSPVAGSKIGSTSSDPDSWNRPPISAGTRSALMPTSSFVGLDVDSKCHPGARDERPLTFLRVELAVLHQDRTTLEDDLGKALHLQALETGVVDVHVMGLRGQDPLVVGVEHDDVGVRARRDRPLPRVEPEHLGRRRRHELDEPVQADPPVVDPLEDQRVPVLHARQPVRDLREVVLAQLLLALVVERRVVGGHDLEVVLLETRPQLLLMILGAQGWGAHELRALEPGPGHVVGGKIEVLGTRLGVRRQAPVPGLAHRVQCVARGQVHDVRRRAGQLGQLERPVDGLPLHRGGAGHPVVLRFGLPLREVLLDQHVDRAAVLRVHHDQGAAVRGPLHGPEDRGVVQHEHPGVRHEQLERRDPLADQLVHLLQDLVVDLLDDHVEPVVGTRLLGLLVPGVEALAEALSGPLEGEVDHRGGPAEGRRPGSGAEVVRAERPAEREVEVRVRVHPAGHHVPVGGVDDLVGLD